MNFTLKNLPERTIKPRQIDFTMAMDKGPPVYDRRRDFVSMCAEHVDIVNWAGRLPCHPHAERENQGV